MSYAQRQSHIDSILTLLKSDKEDAHKVDHLNQLAYQFQLSGNFTNGLNYGQKALELATKNNFKKGTAEANSIIGTIYLDQANYPKAVECYLSALKTEEEIGNKKNIATILGNLGVVYFNQHNYTKAFDYNSKALSIDEEIGNKKGVGMHLSNIGNLWFFQANYPKALDYYFKALKIDEETGNRNEIGAELSNIGNIYGEQMKYAEALDYYFKSLRIASEVGNKVLQANTLANIGSVYTLQKKYKAAELYLERALAISDSLGALDFKKVFENSMSELYILKGDYKKALAYYKQYTNTKDSIFNEEKSKELTKHEMNHEFEKKEAKAKADQDKKDAVTEAETKKQQTVLLLVCCVLLLLFVFSVFIFRSLSLTKKQKQVIEIKSIETEEQKAIVEQQKLEVEQQKHLVEEKQKEIIDSITYAKRLQQAILPSNEEIKKHLPNSFIYYFPKDIVAGDFYWMEHLDETTYIAAADSTGHGVPGAMVSVVCSNALNRAVKEFGMRETGEILDQTRKLVLETFAKSGEEIKDGMDISLLLINKKKKQISWSGANNQLWYISNNELKEINPDKQPIGKTDNPTPFTTHHIGLKQDDIFYLMTDGYADQFGGSKGKKFKFKQLEEILMAHSKKEMHEQKIILEKYFNEWKGDLEQVDDVCIIGIRI